MCLSFNTSKRRQAVISQHRRDNVASPCISRVQPSPKWHIDNNIHKNKRHSIPNYWQATYIYFSSFQNDKSFKLHLASAAWRCPLSKSTGVPVCLGRLAKKIPPPPSVLLWVETVTNLPWRFPFSILSSLWLLLCFIVHFFGVELGKTACCSYIKYMVNGIIEKNMRWGCWCGLNAHFWSLHVVSWVCQIGLSEFRCHVP